MVKIVREFMCHSSQCSRDGEESANGRNVSRRGDIHEIRPRSVSLARIYGVPTMCHCCSCLSSGHPSKLCSDMDYNPLNSRKCVGGSHTVTKRGLQYVSFSFCFVRDYILLVGFCIFFCAYHIVG